MKTGVKAILIPLIVAVLSFAATGCAPTYKFPSEINPHSNTQFGDGHACGFKGNVSGRSASVVVVVNNGADYGISCHGHVTYTYIICIYQSQVGGEGSVKFNNTNNCPATVQNGLAAFAGVSRLGLSGSYTW